MDLKESDILQEKIFSHWYYKSKSNVILSLINNRKIKSVLDIGAGSGYFAKIILERTDAEFAICIDTGYEKDFEETYSGKKIYFKREVAENLNVDLVLLMDVIEHVSDDQQFLESWTKKINNEDALFIVTVPAFQFLFSTHDIFLEHFRRYNIFNLRRLMINCGMKIHLIFYFYGVLFFPIAIIRLFKKIFSVKNQELKSDMVDVSMPLNNFLVFIHKIEIFFMKINKFFGVSLVCLFQKK
ncbi:MAG: methyltransferase [Leptospiraceae bacterium]|nr:methyltransferase [Leptospiraceae bacterium]